MGYDAQFCHDLSEMLSEGLRDRVSLIHSWTTKENVWSTNEAAPQKPEKDSVLTGLLLRPEQAFRMIDHGPATEEKEATAFRHFWGKKAELRRFQDGSMLETLIWESDSGEHAIEQIIRYIIQRHLGKAILEGIEVYGNIFNNFISDAGPMNPFNPFMSDFEALEKDIRNTENLPLQIRHVSATGAMSRYAALRPGPKAMLKKQEQTNWLTDVTLQFEGSARWPNDLVAVQRIKIAFLLKISEALQSNASDLTARLGFENESHRLLNNAFLDLVYANKSSFRLRIHHEREMNLLESALKDGNIAQSSREEIAVAIAAYKKAFIQAELHAQSVRALCTRHSLLSPSMRLMKRWRDSHLLSGHISDELIELLTIRSFVAPFPFQTPGSLVAAFLRSLLSISKWDWRNDPLIVDLNGSMTTKDIEAIHLRFEAWRKIDPAMNRVVLFAATKHDPSGITWTEYRPSKVVAERFTQLAKAACKLVQDHGLGLQADMLFTPSVAEYDFLLQVNDNIRNDYSRSRSKRSAFKNLQIQDAEDVQSIDNDPLTLYVEELRRLHGNDVLFFFDDWKRSIIAGLWNPQTGPRPWKINLSYSTIPSVATGEEMITINKLGTLHRIAMLGGDLVRKIEVK